MYRKTKYCILLLGFIAGRQNAYTLLTKIRGYFKMNEAIKKIKCFFFLSVHIHFEIFPNFCEQYIYIISIVVYI